MVADCLSRGPAGLLTGLAAGLEDKRQGELVAFGSDYTAEPVLGVCTAAGLAFAEREAAEYWD